MGHTPPTVMAGLKAICSDSLWKLSMFLSRRITPTGWSGKSSSGHTCRAGAAHHPSVPTCLCSYSACDHAGSGSRLSLSWPGLHVRPHEGAQNFPSLAGQVTRCILSCLLTKQGGAGNRDKCRQRYQTQAKLVCRVQSCEEQSSRSFLKSSPPLCSREGRSPG